MTKICLTVPIVQLFDMSICNGVIRTEMCGILCSIVQFVLGTVMCMLMAAKFVRDSLRMYQATRTRQLNKYINLLVRDGLLYFIVYVPSSPSFFRWHRDSLNNTL